jgi:CRP/FNR family transcriptional regulator, anaerobic regulatory protein
MHADTLARLLSSYPAIAALPADARDRVLQTQVQQFVVPDGTRLFEEGTPCQGFPLVLSGAVRVARGSPTGRTLELYRVTPGEMCVVSTTCLFGHAGLTAHGVSFGPTELVLLTAQGLEAWCAHEAFRSYVFGVFAERLSDLMTLAEAIAFQKLDQRLATLLLGHGSSLHVTHQELADQLGSVREIVSRLLSRFERAGWVRLQRERIELLDSNALRELAAGRAET